MPNVLITGARAPVALEIARNFARSGHKVIMADSLTFPLARNTNSISRFYSIEKPRGNISGFKESLLRVIKEQRIDYIIPTCEEVFYISFIKPELEEYCDVVCPPFEVVSQLHSKSRILELCNDFAVGLPETSVMTLDALKSISEFDDKIVKREFCRFGNDVMLEPTVDKVSNIKPDKSDNKFLLQEKIYGDEYCVYAVANKGQLNAVSIYQPRYKLKQAAGVYFSAADNKKIQKFTEEFCLKYQITGQVSFDFIVNKDNAYLIECNPRATSGVHLLEHVDLSLSLLGDKQCVLGFANSEAKMIGLVMVLVALPGALITLSFRKWWGDFKSAKDVISSTKDKTSIAFQVASLAELFLIALKNKTTLREASTADIEWDGEDIV